MMSRPPTLHNLVCEECRCPFQSGRAHARYCSDACKQAHYRHTKNSGIAQKHDAVIHALDALETATVPNRDEMLHHLMEISEYINIMREEILND